MAIDGERCLAVMGYLCGVKELSGLLSKGLRWDGPDALLPGHYALAFADLGKGILVLYRDPDGGEPLYYVRGRDRLTFASSLRPLLELLGPERRLAADSPGECVLGGDGALGGQSPCDGVAELLPGQMLVWTRSGVTTKLVHPFPGGDAPLGSPSTPRGFRECLSRAMSLAIGGDDRAAVLLSGGPDSSTIAALAVERLGAGNVTAFTYEFDDPEHVSEASDAALVCRHLGIRHHVIRIPWAGFWEAIPEIVWRTESYHSPVVQYGVPVLIASRRVAELGFEKLLTGTGMEQLFGILLHPAYLEGLGRLLRWLPRPELSLRYWKWSMCRRPACARLLRLLHPGLEPPPWVIRYLILSVLQHNGLLRDASRLLPNALRPLGRALIPSPRLAEAVAETRDLSLSAQLKLHDHRFFVTGRCLRYTQKPAREYGVTQVSPALFPVCAGWVAENTRRMAGDRRKARAWHQEVMRGDLPEAVFRRPKIRDQAVISRRWWMRAVRDMRALLGDTLSSIERGIEGRYGLHGRATEECDGLATAALWQRMFVERDPGSVPPGWDALTSGRAGEYDLSD